MVSFAAAAARKTTRRTGVQKKLPPDSENQPQPWNHFAIVENEPYFVIYDEDRGTDSLKQGATSSATSSRPGPSQDKCCATSSKPALVDIRSPSGASAKSATRAAVSPGKQRRLAAARDLPDTAADQEGGAYETTAFTASLQQGLCKPATGNTDSPRMTSVTKMGSSYAELRTYKIPKVKQPSPLKERGNLCSRSPPVVQECRRQLLGERDEVAEDLGKILSPPSDAAGVSGPSSTTLVDQIMDDMNKSFPRLTAGFLVCDDPLSVCQEMDTSEIFRSPVRRPLETEYDSRCKAIRPVQLENMHFSGSSGRKEQRNRICSLCGRRSVSESSRSSSRETCIRCSLCEEITREQATVKDKVGKPEEPNTTPLRSLRRMSSDVENKEDTGVPSTVQDSLKTNVMPPQKKRKKVEMRRPRRVYISRPLIISSEESSENESDCSRATNCPAGKKVDALSSPCKLHSRTEPRREGDNSGKEHLNDTCTNSVDSTRIIFRAEKKTNAKSNAKQRKPRGSREEYVRRKEMKMAWRKAKDTDDYLRMVSKMQRKSKTLNKVDICEKATEPEEVNNDLVCKPSSTSIDTTGIKVDVDMPAMLTDVTSQPVLVISSCHSLSITDWENQESQCLDASEPQSNIENESKDGNEPVAPVNITVSSKSGSSDNETGRAPWSPVGIQKARAGLYPTVDAPDSESNVENESKDGNEPVAPVNIVVSRSGSSDSKTECVPRSPLVIKKAQAGLHPTVVCDSLDESQETLEEDSLLKYKKAEGQKSITKLFMGVPYTVSYEEDGAISVMMQRVSCNQEILTDEEDGRSTGHIEEAGDTSCITNNKLASSTCLRESTTVASQEDSPMESTPVNLEKQANFLASPPASPLCESGIGVDLHIINELDMPSGTPHLPPAQNSEGKGKAPCSERFASSSHHSLPSAGGTETCYDAFSPVDLFESPGAVADGADKCSEGLHRLLEEYAQRLESFFTNLYYCNPDVRMMLVDALLPDGFIALKKIVHLIWKMEDQLGCLDVVRVWNLERSIFLALGEYTALFQNAPAAELSLPPYMSFELPDAHLSSGDKPSGKAAERVEAQNGKEGSEAWSRPANAPSSAPDQLQRTEASSPPTESLAMDCPRKMTQDSPAAYHIGCSAAEVVENDVHSSNTGNVQELGRTSPEDVENSAERPLQIPTGDVQVENANTRKDLLPNVVRTAANSRGHGKAEIEHRAQRSPVNATSDTASHHEETEVLAVATPSSAVDSSLKATEGIPTVPRAGQEQETNSYSRCTAKVDEVVANSTSELWPKAHQSPACAKQVGGVCARKGGSPGVAGVAASNLECLGGPGTAREVAVPSKEEPLPNRFYRLSSGSFTSLQQSQAKAVDSATSSGQQPLRSSASNAKPGASFEQSMAGDCCIEQPNIAASKEMLSQVLITNDVSEPSIPPRESFPSNKPEQEKCTTAPTARFPGHQARRVRYELRDPPPLMRVAPQHQPLAQSEPAASASSMNSAKVQQYNNQLMAYAPWHTSLARVPPNAPLNCDSRFSEHNLQQVPLKLAQRTIGSNSSEQCRRSARASNEEIQVPPPFLGTAGPASRQILSLHHAAPSMQPEILGVEARQQFQQTEQQQAMPGQHMSNSLSSVHRLRTLQAASTNHATPRKMAEQSGVSKNSAAPSRGKEPIMGQTRDAELLHAEDELRKKLERQCNLEKLLMRAQHSGKFPGQQMGRTEHPSALQETDVIIRDQIRLALIRWPTNHGVPSAQQRQVHKLFQQSEHQYTPQYGTPQLMRPWEERPLEQAKWPYPYTACQEALERFKDHQYAEGVEVHEANLCDSAEPSLNGYQAVPQVAPWRTLKSHGQRQPSCQASVMGSNLPAHPDTSQSKGKEAGTAQQNPSVPYRHATGELGTNAPHGHPSLRSHWNAGSSRLPSQLQHASGEPQSGQQLFGLLKHPTEWPMPQELRPLNEHVPSAPHVP
ncbi:uncharacterized protein LOC144121834 isoform X2 [Amblyomma americanum]